MAKGGASGLRPFVILRHGMRGGRQITAMGSGSLLWMSYRPHPYQNWLVTLRASMLRKPCTIWLEYCLSHAAGISPSLVIGVAE